MVLNGFSQTPWLEWAYYSQMAVLEPGSNLTGQVKITYQSKLPSPNTSPYFWLLSSSQFGYDNAQVGFRNHVFKSLPWDANRSLPDNQSITIPFTIVNIGEKSVHYFVIVPEQDIAHGVLFERMVVDLTVDRVVTWTFPILTMQIVSLVSFTISGVEQWVGYRERGR